MKSVLIVDDSIYVRSALRTFLSAKLRVCDEAADGLEAVQKAQEHQPDLILMDFAMPNMNGAEAAAVIKTTLPETRIVMYTFHSDSIGKSLAKAIGVDLVLSKSNSASALIDALQTVLADHSSAIQPKLANRIAQSGE